MKRWLWVLLTSPTWGCSLAPRDVEPPPIFELSGAVQLDRSELDIESPEILLALSWYVFTTNSLDPAPFALATQTSIAVDGERTFSLDLTQVPPPSAFVLTGEDQFLQLPAEGNLAIGFITARPWDSSVDEDFDWRDENMIYQTCPWESQLIVWWDGPELDSDETGFESGTLRKGLNLVDLQYGDEGPWGYQLLPANAPISIAMCDEGLRAPLRSCGLPQDRSVDTIYVSGSENQDENPDPPEGSFECDPCGISYRVPDVCVRRFDILCRDCRSLVVETDPNDPVPSWVCDTPPGECDPDNEPLCLLGRRFGCDNNTWRLIETCSDHCCETNCNAE